MRSALRTTAGGRVQCTRRWYSWRNESGRLDIYPPRPGISLQWTAAMEDAGRTGRDIDLRFDTDLGTCHR